MVVILSTFCPGSLAEVADGEEIIILDDESEASYDEIDLEISDEFDLPVEEIQDEIDLLDAGLIEAEDSLSDDPESAYADNAVSNDAPSGIMNNGEGGIYIDINASPYTDFALKSYGGYAYGTQGCAWFASARLCQVTGIDCIISSGTSWYNERYAWYGLERGTSFPNSGKALVCYGSHIAVIEKVDGNRALISEGGEYYSSDAAHGYCIIHWMDVSKVKNRLGGAIGYVYFGRQPIASGKCGDDVYWDLYEDKVLEIHGSGAMWDFYESINGGSPWYDYCYVYRDDGSLIDRIEVQPGVTYIGANAFFEQEFSQIEIADSVDRIGEFAFCRSEGFDSIVLPDKIRTIPDCAFEECDLESIKLPGNLEVIELGAFFQCRSLESIEFPDTLRTIGNMAFAVTGLESIHIPRNVEQVDSRAFWASTYDSPKGTISRITVDSNNKSYLAKDNVLYSKNMDTLVYCAPQKTGKLSVSASVRYIMASAFDCSRLTEVVLPEGILRIDDGAFAGAENLKKLNLPASLVTISEDAFRVGDYEEWGGLKNVTIYAPYGSYAHKYCRSQDAKHNPYGYVNNYIITKTLSKTGSNGKVTINKGEKLQLIPVKRNGSTIAIKSCKSNSKIAKVSSSGIVTGVSAGETKVTVQPKGTKAMTIKVKVKDPYAPTGIKLNKSGTVKLALGKTLQLKATVTPSTAETTLTWSSSDSRIAKVNKKGKVTAVKKGTATITVTTSNGKTAKVKIKVVKGSGGGGGGGGY